MWWIRNLHNRAVLERGAAKKLRRLTVIALNQRHDAMLLKIPPFVILLFQSSSCFYVAAIFVNSQPVSAHFKLEDTFYR